jgi:hypothetical protein
MRRQTWISAWLAVAMAGALVGALVESLWLAVPFALATWALLIARMTPFADRG